MKRNSLYIHYGCGLHAPETWENFDASPTLIFEKIPLIGRLYTKNSRPFPKNVKRGCIVKGLPIEENTANAIYCSHVLEHLSHNDCQKALKNTYKYLKKGGLFRLVVPDLKAAIDEYSKNTDESAALRFMQTTLLGVQDRPRGLLGLIKNHFGNSQHLWMWDKKSLRAALQTAGFQKVRIAEIGDSEEKKFKEVENPERFKQAICMEMTK